MDVDIYEIFNYIKDNSDNKQELADNMNSLIMATDNSKFSITLNRRFTFVNRVIIMAWVRTVPCSNACA